MTRRTTHLRTSEQVCDIARVTYRQLDYWTRNEWVRPVRERFPGSGNPRYYSEEETQRVVLMGQLVAAGLLPGTAYRLTQQGEYDDAGIYRAKLYGHVYVEVFP